MHFYLMFKFLLIDDELPEKDLIDAKLERVFSAGGYLLDHVYKSSEAIKCLLKDSFDFILLDNNLASSISSQFSVPVIRQYVRDAKLIIVSNNIHVDYLKDESILGVDGIVNKADFESYMTTFRRSLSDNDPRLITHPNAQSSFAG
jgi:CheY-like chemotaxis protein